MIKEQPLYWYALYTSPRAEKQVEQRLKTLHITCFLPLHRTPRVWSDRVKMVEIPLYSSYIFVQCHEHQLRNLLGVFGVSRIVYYNGKPAVIREKEIDTIRTFLQKANEYPLVVGEEVTILAGDLKNISGKIKKIKKKYLVLHLEQLGATVCVEMEKVAPVKKNK